MGGGLPVFIVQLVAAELRQELENTRLTVLKIRSRDGWIRCPITSNPGWYSELCAAYVRRRRQRRWRRERTFIKTGRRAQDAGSN
jgi:hypothetical protein